MADISSIKLPSGSSYNIKDTSARSSLDGAGTNANLITTDDFYSANTTMAHDSNVNIDIDITKNGYTALGVVGWAMYNATTNGVNNTWCEAYMVYLYDSTTVRASIRNYANDTANIRVRVWVLYKKNS